MNNYFSYIDIEREAQTFWEDNKCFEIVEDINKEKFYCLCMFPYPSGNLHIGHVRNYTIGDVISRLQRMLGKNVLNPIGWDAFGMPAENAAKKNIVSPNKWTYTNIEYMRKQLKNLGFSYNWDREITTCNLHYYRWEQWFFIKLIDHGLIYKTNASVNWDPLDNTILANEQVINGIGWRSGAKVERRKIPIWFFKITEYAAELLKCLENIDWPESVKKMQINWIGKSKGIEIFFKVMASVPNFLSKLKVFTTRPDTLLGVTYIILAPDHPLVELAAQSNKKLNKFCNNFRIGGNSSLELLNKEKIGLYIGYKVLHPITNEYLPIYVSNFIIMEYGTGAIMGVPAHDNRDWEFAINYGLPIKPVISDNNGNIPDISKKAYTEYGLLINSGIFNKLNFFEAFDSINKYIKKINCGVIKTLFRLRDWCISRQRYWGTPIPIKYGTEGQTVPLTDKELPIYLPTDVIFNSKFNLKKLTSFYDLGNGWVRDTDTFDTFIESSWYYARFCCNDNKQSILDARVNYWLPVDMYIGGIEHAILHLLYARFFHKLMRDFGLFECDEPFKKLITQGMVVTPTYYREIHGKKEWFNPLDVKLNKDKNTGQFIATLTTDGATVISSGIEKMSKSKNNGIDPKVLIDKFGADTLRLFIMFSAPTEQSLIWSETGIRGANRFIKRLWNIGNIHISKYYSENNKIKISSLTPEQFILYRKTHKTIKKATEDMIIRHTFNTVIAKVMKLTNLVSRFIDYSIKGLAVTREALKSIILILAPIVPHITHILWKKMGYSYAIIDAKWPTFNEECLVGKLITVLVQINGKLRKILKLPINYGTKKFASAILSSKQIKCYIIGKNINKIIIVPGKLINIVVYE
ncbi:leucine--tRNA ligase [Candidatus Portiera aleyrodidarum]|uniref:Leucine--tRNA ligase n=1 Tax=Candidatus Portiera aleyrodidarum TaxID=91844 RepID=A0A6S6RQR9_9GAMM|nr:leucine--tRNA ligase [Candidatus Portiera aleyrodidarum]CAA3705533.1 Leucine--tRNA ligase [Candidatus Portiera aleyrodidarum]